MTKKYLSENHFEIALATFSAKGNITDISEKACFILFSWQMHIEKAKKISRNKIRLKFCWWNLIFICFRYQFTQRLQHIGNYITRTELITKIFHTWISSYTFWLLTSISKLISISIKISTTKALTKWQLTGNTIRIIL